LATKGFKDGSALLKHELAYVLGQMGQLSAIPILTNVLEDLHEDPMVRHEVSHILYLTLYYEQIKLELGCRGSWRYIRNIIAPNSLEVPERSGEGG